MSTAFDHMLNVLNIALRANERSTAEKEEAREAKRRATAPREPSIRSRSFSGTAPVNDPSCCLAKRRFTK